MQLCAYNLTINYYMVKLTNHKKAIDRPLSCKRWGIIAIIILFAGSLSFLLYSYFSHDVDNPQCNCLLCMLNHVPEEGEYIYNRYLIFISFIWIAVIFAAVFLVNYCFVKKEQKEIRHGLLVYCELDTLAMVKLWERFKEIIGEK